MVDQGKYLYVLRFIQPFSEYLFLTLAVWGEQPQLLTERGSLSLGAVIPVIFSCDTLPNWSHLVKSSSFRLLLLVVVFVTAISRDGDHGRQHTVHPAAGNQRQLLWRLCLGQYCLFMISR